MQRILQRATSAPAQPLRFFSERDHNHRARSGSARARSRLCSYLHSTLDRLEPGTYNRRLCIS